MNDINITWKKLYRFFTVPRVEHIFSLSIFRISIAFFAILQAILWYPDWLSFFGKDGWIQWEISRAMIPESGIHIEEVYEWLSFSRLNEDQFTILFFWIYLSSLTGLLVGIYTRYCAILTWFCHYIIMNTVETYVYGVDIFLHIALFYLMIMPVNKCLSLDAIFKKKHITSSWTATLSLRVMQIHLTLIYFSAGFEKMLSVEWWNGNTLWRSLVQPDFARFNLEWLANYTWVVILLSCFTILIETGYCIAMWIPRLRIFWLAAIILLHAGIAVFLGLWMFSLIMIIFSISVFGCGALDDVKKWYKKRKMMRTDMETVVTDAAPIIMG